jgi:hypothetical protein
MSFDVYLQCFAGKRLGIPRAAIHSLFPILEEKSEPDYWCVFYDRTDSCSISVTSAESDSERITFLSLNRPCADLRFWESVLAILRMGSVILYWPGGGPLMAGGSDRADLPPEIVKSLGQPALVNSAREIIDAIRSS